MNGEDSLRIPEGHWLNEIIDDQLEAVLKYFKLEYKTANNRLSKQLKVLQAAAENKSISKLVAKNKIDYENQFLDRESRTRSDSKDRLINVDHLTPVNVQTLVEKGIEKETKNLML